jgi:heme exporter protein CcmD
MNMDMNGFYEYLDMGGYARYVWPAYIIVIGAIALNVVLARRALKLAQRAAARRLAVNSPPSQPGTPEVGIAK